MTYKRNMTKTSSTINKPDIKQRTKTKRLIRNNPYKKEAKRLKN